MPRSADTSRLFETREERLARQIATVFEKLNEARKRYYLGPDDYSMFIWIQELSDDGLWPQALREARDLLATIRTNRPKRGGRFSSARRRKTSKDSAPQKPRKPKRGPEKSKATSKAAAAAKPTATGSPASEDKQPVEERTFDLPLPEVSPDAAPIAFVSTPDDELLVKLLRGDHDVPESFPLLRRGIELLAEEGFDRLLALDEVRGVDHYAHQLETVLRVLKRFRGRVLLADEVGLGKTIESCLVLKEYMLRGQVRRALILVPPALVGQWAAELREKFAVDAVTTRDALCRSDPAAFWSSRGVIVASLATARSAGHAPLLGAQSFDLVMVDEAHHIKNRTTKGWRLVNELRSRFFLLLTATPIETNLSELYNLVTLLRPGTLGTAAEFRRRFVDADDPAQPKDPEKLRDLLREVMIRNTRAVSGVVLPPRSARTIVVSPSPEERRFYELLLLETRRHAGRHRALFRLLLEEAGSSPLAVASTAAASKQRGRDPGLDRALGEIEEAAYAVTSTEKLERLAELVPGDKVLVFTRFRATMDQIAGDLAGRGVSFVPFHGGMSAVEKDRAAAAFAGAGVDVMLCSEIGGEGRNLQFCHRLINFDLPWNPMKIEQRIGRVHRIGQTEAVEIVNLACADTVEEHILDVLDRRVNLFELVIGEMDMLLGELSDEREFDDQVFDIFANSEDPQEVDAGFDALAQRLLDARGKVEKTRALDEALFGRGYEA